MKGTEEDSTFFYSAPPQLSLSHRSSRKSVIPHLFSRQKKNPSLFRYIYTTPFHFSPYHFLSNTLSILSQLSLLALSGLSLSLSYTHTHSDAKLIISDCFWIWIISNLSSNFPYNIGEAELIFIDLGLAYYCCDFFCFAS